MGIYHRRGRLIAESRERVASAKPLPGDEVDQFVDLTSIVWKSPLNRLLMSRMASGPFKFKGMDEGNTKAFLFFNG